ncbi:hypothetical protein LH452_14440 [Laribacter hongkongensis]|uniref:hypothetical protein n=1 Tax=Laribacter hongkongensis TaxID=168471 RepID=UPI001EFCE8D2|nr:hypothetical protein [Laribacter hongkongensis]MCG9060093.1 hypothetical protein [Laribacter hongkongensis]
MPHLYDEDGWNWLDGGEKIFRKVGRSRKRIIGIRKSPRPVNCQDRGQAFEAELARLRAITPNDVQPHIKVKRCRYGYLVKVVTRSRIVTWGDLQTLADALRSVLRHDQTFAEVFGE